MKTRVADIEMYLLLHDLNDSRQKAEYRTCTDADLEGSNLTVLEPVPYEDLDAMRLRYHRKRLGWWRDKTFCTRTQRARKCNPSLFLECMECRDHED